MNNKSVGKLLKLAADLLEISADNSFKIASFQRAARAIETLGEPVTEVANKGQLAEVPGVGSSMKKNVMDILSKGTFDELEMLKKNVPQGVQDMLKIKNGIGPKKIRHFWLNMGLLSIEDVYVACAENRLQHEKGFGEKTQTAVLNAIEYLRSSQGKFLYGKIMPLAENLLTHMQAVCTHPLAFTGAIRRKCEILTKVEVLVDAQNKPAIQQFIQQFNEGKGEDEQQILDIQTTEKGLQFYINQPNVPFLILFTDDFERDLFFTSSTEAHISQLKNEYGWDGNLKNESGLYESLSIPFVQPELREGRGELAGAKDGKYVNLIEEADIKGVIHAHSTYSDGANTLKDMALACKKKGYEYLLITDHSQYAFYANGLTIGRVEAQHEEIAKLNATLAPFKIFKGIEADILPDGSLDYNESVWQNMDCIIASVHSNLNMDAQKATQRILRALENPYTRILGHPTGRLLLAREGYGLDHEKVIDACADLEVVIELNANPLRLDLDWRWIEYALKKGVKIAINPDAHSIEGIDDIRWGVAAARKGGLPKDMCLNTLSIADFEAFCKKR